MTKIDIVSGFLGAGKTTLIKKLLAEAYKGEKLVLIENEFGEINIDGGFLKESGIQISEMSAGCICCSLVGDFNKALKDVEAQFHPDRILIEPSGVGKLSDVIVAVENTVKDVPDMKLNSFVTVADATKVKVYMKNFGEFYNNQIESAGTIILSRTQKLSQEKLEAAAAMLREKNADAAILSAAVADYRPVSVPDRKIKKTGERMILELERTADILGSMRAEFGFSGILVGFAAETHNVENNAIEKLKRKKLDFIAANDVTAEGAGFGTDTNIITLYGADGSREHSGMVTKREAADWLLDRLVK